MQGSVISHSLCSKVAILCERLHTGFLPFQFRKLELPVQFKGRKSTVANRSGDFQLLTCPESKGNRCSAQPQWLLPYPCSSCWVLSHRQELPSLRDPPPIPPLLPLALPLHPAGVHPYPPTSAAPTVYPPRGSPALRCPLVIKACVLLELPQGRNHVPSTVNFLKESKYLPGIFRISELIWENSHY